jgi:hydroxymethylpyrimidine/phosphomethylpyrimidine kinase
MTVAGSDSGAGAGIQADLKTFAALGVYGVSAITAVTAQNTLGVTAVFELPADMVAAQIDAIAEDMGADAVKTGMLASAEIIAVVAERVQRHGLRNLVVDPVMVAKSGDPLLRADAVDALRHQLLPLATVVTPNLPEAEVLVGRSLESEEDLEAAARQIASWGAEAVVVKGGHRPGPEAVDLLYWRGTFQRLAAPRVETASTHGTGCTFASAIAAGLACGLEVPEAVARAKEYLTEALRRAYPVGRGRGPVDHFWRWRPPDA